MRFQTLSILAIGIIGVGVYGMLNIQSIYSTLADEPKSQKEVIKVRMISKNQLELKEDLDEGAIISADQVSLIKIDKSEQQIKKDKTKKYIESLSSLTNGIYITNKNLKKGSYLLSSDVVSLGNIRDENKMISLTFMAEISSIENFKAGLYDIYWLFNVDKRESLRSGRLKKFSENVFLKLKVIDKDVFSGRLNENNSVYKVYVVAQVRVEDIGLYLQAERAGEFKIINKKDNIAHINVNNYSKIVVRKSKELQINDISKRYQYDIKIIKGS